MTAQQQAELLRRAAGGIAGLARGAYGVAANAVDAAGNAIAAAHEEAKQRRLAREQERIAQAEAQAEEAARIVIARAKKQTLANARAARQTSAFRVTEQDKAREQDAMDARMQREEEEDRVRAAQAASRAAQAAAEARQTAKVEEAKKALAAAQAEAERAALEEGAGASAGPPSAGPQVPNAAPAAGVRRGLPANVPGMQGQQQGVIHPPGGLTMATGARNALGLKRLFERIEGRPLPDKAFDSKGNFIKEELKQWWTLNSTSPDPELNKTFWETVAAVDNQIDTEKPPKNGKRYRTHNNSGASGRGKPHGSDKRKRSASLSGSEKEEESGEVVVKKKRKGRWPAGSQEARDEMARIRAMRKT